MSWLLACVLIGAFVVVTAAGRARAWAPFSPRRLRQLANKSKRNQLTAEEMGELAVIASALNATDESSLHVLFLRATLFGILCRVPAQIVGPMLETLLDELDEQAWDTSRPRQHLAIFDGADSAEGRAIAAVDVLVALPRLLRDGRGSVEPPLCDLFNQAVGEVDKWLCLLDMAAAMRHQLLPSRYDLESCLVTWTQELAQHHRQRFDDALAPLLPPEPALALATLRAAAFGETAPSDATLVLVTDRLAAAFRAGRGECLEWTGDFGELEEIVDRACTADGGIDLAAARDAFDRLRALAEDEATPSYTVDLPERLALLRERAAGDAIRRLGSS